MVGSTVGVCQSLQFQSNTYTIRSHHSVRIHKPTLQHQKKKRFSWVRFGCRNWSRQHWNGLNLIHRNSIQIHWPPIKWRSKLRSVHRSYSPTEQYCGISSIWKRIFLAKIKRSPIWAHPIWKRRPQCLHLACPLSQCWKCQQTQRRKKMPPNQFRRRVSPMRSPNDSTHDYIVRWKWLSLSPFTTFKHILSK